MATPVLDDQPDPDEIEVSVFGPGVGESIVMHLGGGEWVVVDSCREHATRQPAALAYFERLQLDPASVTTVVATHWDSDHIRGLAKIVNACPDAAFWCTAAVGSEEFETLLDLTTTRPEQLGRRLRELAEIVAERRERLGDGHGTPSLAMEATLVLDRPAAGSLPRRSIHALSPSQRATLMVAADAGRALSNGAEIKQRVQRLSRNDTSAVLLVSFGEDGVLLGADLERSQDATRGWMPAVRRARELGITASLVKIPHHGSPTAHDEQMWSDALKPNPGAALTPFFSGTSPLPQPDDRTRIRGLTSRGYLTTDKAQSTDTALLSAALPGGLVRAIEGNVGHVRWRRKLDGSDDWRVTLDENACGV